MATDGDSKSEIKARLFKAEQVFALLKPISKAARSAKKLIPTLQE